MTEPAKRLGRMQFLLIALIFFGPLGFAAWMYLSVSSLTPQSRTNAGALLEPIVSLTEAVPDLGLPDEADGTWVMLYANAGDCDDGCRAALYRLRQSRLMLGDEMSRVTRVFLHGDTPPDTLFLEAQHAGLKTTQNGRLGALLESKRPADVAQGGIFLIDPLGNLVMYFSPELDPAEMVDDIEHLLRLSRIG